MKTAAAKVWICVVISKKINKKRPVYHYKGHKHKNDKYE